MPTIDPGPGISVDPGSRVSVDPAAQCQEGR
jgi:hypothetical protein